MGIFSSQTDNWERIKIEFDPNDMYIEEMKHFIRCIEGKESPLIDGKNAQRVVQIALAAKEAAKTGEVILL